MSDYATAKEIELGIRLIESVAKERITSLESQLAAAKAEIYALKKTGSIWDAHMKITESENKRLREALAQLVKDGECFCLGNKLCSWCEASTALDGGII